LDALGLEAFGRRRQAPVRVVERYRRSLDGFALDPAYNPELLPKELTMRRILAGMAIASACGLGAAQPAAAVDLQDTRLLTQPAISARQVLFVYAGDLWICD